MPDARVVLYDDAVARAFEPFATTRPFGEQRSGALLVRERWTHVFGGTAWGGFVSGAWLDGFSDSSITDPDTATACRAVDPAAALDAGTWIVNTRAMPFLARLETGRVSSRGRTVSIDGRIAAVCLAAPLATSMLRDGAMALEEIASTQGIADGSAISGVWIDELWDQLAQLSTLLSDDIPRLARTYGCDAVREGDAQRAVIGAHSVWMEAGAIVEPFVTFDTSAGPILVRRGAQIQSFTRIVGPCFVGEGSIVSTDRIANCAIGEVCRVHGEVSTSIFTAYSNKGHDGFVGHSIVGRWVNLGAGTITSNLKNTYGAVALWTPTGVRWTGQQFLGTMFGDHVKTGIGLRLTTGCVLGAGANVYEHMPPKMVPPFTWGRTGAYEAFAQDKFVAIAARMMQRRHVTLSAAEREFLAAVHAASRGMAHWRD